MGAPRGCSTAFCWCFILFQNGSFCILVVGDSQVKNNLFFLKFFLFKLFLLIQTIEGLSAYLDHLDFQFA